MNLKQKFSIRKTTVGVASALLGTSLLFSSLLPVHAETAVTEDAVEEKAEVDLETAQENYDKAVEEFKAAGEKLEEFNKLVAGPDKTELDAANKAVADSNKNIIDLKAAKTKADNAVTKAEKGKANALAEITDTDVKDLIEAIEDRNAEVKVLEEKYETDVEQVEEYFELNQEDLDQDVEDAHLALNAKQQEIADLEAEIEELEAKAESILANLPDGDETDPEYQAVLGKITAKEGELSAAEAELPGLESAYDQAIEDADKELALQNLAEQLATDIENEDNALEAAKQAIFAGKEDDEIAKITKAADEFLARDFDKELADAKAEAKAAAEALEAAEKAHPELVKAAAEAQKAFDEADKANKEAKAKFLKDNDFAPTATDAEVRTGLNSVISQKKVQVDLAEIILKQAKEDAGIVDEEDETKAGFVKEDGEWVFYENGEKKTGWHKADYGTWYFFDAKGVMATGWRKVNGTWYFFEDFGGMATGWKKIGGTWYYLNPSGAMATGWKKINGTWYYLNPSGAMATGWKKVDGNWYYFFGSGAMASNRALNLGGRVYRFAPSGRML